jgi:hypothetical protein
VELKGAYVSETLKQGLLEMVPKWKLMIGLKS